jgi:hypothetical protein
VNEHCWFFFIVCWLCSVYFKIQHLFRLLS